MTVGYGIFSEEREDNIKNKVPFFGKLPIDVPEVFNWNEYMTLMSPIQKSYMIGRLKK